MRKPAFSICKKQRHRSAAADQRLCFCFIDSKVLSSIRNYKPGLYRTWSSHDEAHLKEMQYSHMHHCVFIQFIHDIIQVINCNLLLI